MRHNVAVDGSPFDVRILGEQDTLDGGEVPPGSRSTRRAVRRRRKEGGRHPDETMKLSPTEIFNGRNVFILGATGFVGKVMLWMLLDRSPASGGST